jgi:hypothetical protein
LSCRQWLMLGSCVRMLAACSCWICCWVSDML